MISGLLSTYVAMSGEYITIAYNLHKTRERPDFEQPAPLVSGSGLGGGNGMDITRSGRIIKEM